MRASRRTVLKAGGLGLAASVTAFPGRTAAAAAVRADGTTLASTIRRGPAGAGGYRTLVSGPGEPHRVREGLGVPPRTGRDTRRTPLLAFAHLTDIHVIDAQSPGRLEFTDRYDDGPVSLIFSSAYRPQEVLTTQTADSIVAAVERVGRGPASGRRLDFAICTGDNADNAQLNELRWQIDVLDGTPVRPDSGDLTRWEGVHDANPSSYDTHYWHPDGTPAGLGDDDQRRLHGFPTVPGLLDAARRPFTPIGLSMPWYSCFGHHTSATMDNQLVVAGGDLRLRVTGPQVVQLLLSFPACVLWVCGHTHENAVTPHRRAGGGGFWEVSTASHVDWPSQARLVELLDNRDGTLSVLTTMLDAEAPLSAGRRTGSTRELAALARELAANDPQERSDARLGGLEDRNVELLVPRPFAPTATPVATPTPVARPTPGGAPGAGGAEALALAATGLDAGAPAALAALGAAGIATLAARRLREP